jgi:hypothetical protein
MKEEARHQTGGGLVTVGDEDPPRARGFSERHGVWNSRFSARGRADFEIDKLHEADIEHFVRGLSELTDPGGEMV